MRAGPECQASGFADLPVFFAGPSSGLRNPSLAGCLHCRSAMARKSSPSNPREVVTLADLAPRTRIVGGSERRVFGSTLSSPQEDVMATKSAKDLPAKKTVKAGRPGRA